MNDPIVRHTLPATGDQHRIESDGYAAVVTESGATLRTLTYHGQTIVDGFAESELPTAARGQLLMPWTNRIRDGRYDFEGRSYQLPLSEPARRNASHGLVRWASWTLTSITASSVTLTYRLMAQSGYPWNLDLTVVYAVGSDGLTVTQSACNRSPDLAPYATGAHPYLTLNRPVDGLVLTLPAATRMTTDDRKLPTGLVPADQTEYDFRKPRQVGATVWDHAVTDLARTADGRCTVSVQDPISETVVSLWVDEHHRWLQVYTGDDSPETARRSIAVEPMSAPPDAFRSGTDLIRLAPAGMHGDTHAAQWGIHVS